MRSDDGIGLPAQPIGIDASAPPMLLSVIDTEEEFDWSAPFDPGSTAVTAMRHVGRGQEIFDRRGVRPCYVVDYPVAASRSGREPLQRFVAEGRAVVGAHLHPWVTPPVEEEISVHNSFAGNLPRELEGGKLARLSAELEAAFGTPPVIYKAGRYGFGRRTASLLEEQGFEVDLSFSPPFDYRAEGGPSYAETSCSPFWFGSGRRLLGIPCSGAYVGFWRYRPHRLYSLAKRPALERLRTPGVLSRLGVLERLHLSPEGHSFEEMRRLTVALLRRGIRLFSMSFHSPSLEPGHTPYVRNHAELDAFLGRLRRYLEFFLDELGGVSVTPLEIKERLAGDQR
jgi:hypothetical protein